MQKTIEKLEKIKSEVIELFEKSNIEHKHYLIGDVIVVIKDRLTELNRIVKGGVILQNKPYPQIAPPDHFHRDKEEEDD